jgi:hypothetical protein
LPDEAVSKQPGFETGSAILFNTPANSKIGLILEKPP